MHGNTALALMLGAQRASNDGRTRFTALAQRFVDLVVAALVRRPVAWALG